MVDNAQGFFSIARATGAYLLKGKIERSIEPGAEVAIKDVGKLVVGSAEESNAELREGDVDIPDDHFLLCRLGDQFDELQGDLVRQFLGFFAPNGEDLEASVGLLVGTQYVSGAFEQVAADAPEERHRNDLHND